MIVKESPESYLFSEMEIKTEEKLSFSVASQTGMLSRRFWKKYGIEFSSLEKLKNIYLVYMDGQAFVSDISEEQRELLKKLSVTLEYK